MGKKKTSKPQVKVEKIETKGNHSTSNIPIEVKKKPSDEHKLIAEKIYESLESKNNKCVGILEVKIKDKDKIKTSMFEEDSIWDFILFD